MSKALNDIPSDMLAKALVTKMDEAQRLRTENAALARERDELKAVVKDYGDQIIEERRQRMAEQERVGRAMGFALILPKGKDHDHDYWLFGEREDAEDHAKEVAESDELDMPPPILPLYPLPALAAAGSPPPQEKP
jgi:hypothetical protein